MNKVLKAKMVVAIVAAAGAAHIAVGFAKEPAPAEKGQPIT